MSYNTFSNTYHIWLCSIVTDKVLVKKQEEIEILQEKLMEREEKISQLMENMKGKQLLDILFYQIICLALQSQVVQLHDQIKHNDCQLSQKFEKVLDDRVDDTSKLTSSYHETEDITSQSKI